MVTTLLYFLLPSLFSQAWNSLDGLLNNKLSQSLFHTIERDFLISQNVIFNVMFNLVFLIAALFLLKRKRFINVALIVGMDMIFNTQGMLFFAPASVYPSWEEITNRTGLHQKLIDPQIRTLTRNVNEPYTDYGMYWEAMTVRAPFSDSFVTNSELETYNYLQQIRDSLTPDWNMAFGVPMIHGYTTLLPTDYMNIWQKTDDPRINFIDRVDYNDDLLRRWAVGNYIVDKQFEIKEVLPESIPTPYLILSICIP
jgi:hypothetical protein